MGGIISKFLLTKLVWQGCPLSTLLFAIATHSLLVMLSKMATHRENLGLHLSSTETTNCIGFGG